MSVRNTTLSISTLALTLFVISSYFLNMGNEEEARYQPREENPLAQASQGYKGALEYYSILREGATREKVERTRNAVENFHSPKSSLDLDWMQEGPTNIGGRTRTIHIMKDNNSNMLVGGVSGGLWRSSDEGENWERVPSFDEEVVVSSIVETGNGQIYVGTGSTHESPNGIGGSGFNGRGLYMSSDKGQSFDLVPGTMPDTNVSNGEWTFVNDMAADPNNDDGIWIAKNQGLTYYDGNSFSSASGFLGNAMAVDVSSDGEYVIASSESGSVFLSTDGGDNFNNLSGPGGSLPSASGGGRVEVAIAPSDKDFMYVSMADGSFGSYGRLDGVHMTQNGGDDWNAIAQNGGGSFQPFSNGLTHQGNYDQVIAVNPGDKREIVLGGVTLWKWENVPTQFNPFSGQWSQLATTNGYPATVPFYVHADVHAFAWKDKKDLYVGTDGGVFRSTDGLETFIPHNKGFTSTQFYSIDYSPKDQILGGSQDNGTLFIDREDGWKFAESVRGGDGFACEISQMDPDVLFATTYGSYSGQIPSDIIQRSENGGGQISNFVGATPDIDELYDDFYTNIRLYENPYDSTSQDSVEFINVDPVDSTVYYQGDTIEYNSRTLDKPLAHPCWKDSVTFADTILLPDPVQSLFAFSAKNNGIPGVYVTRDALRLAKSRITAHEVLELNNGQYVECYAFSGDGDHLWIGTRDGELHRVSGLDDAYRGFQFNDSLTTTKVGDFGSIITGIDVNRNDPEHVVVSLGGYGGANKVRQAFDGLAMSPSFNSIWDNSTNLSPGLQGMPVYDVIIERDDPNVILAGTEYGIFATADGGNTWTHQNRSPLGHVPVFDIEQQDLDWGEQGANNPGYIYLGTHGRGFMKSDDFQNTRPHDKLEGDGQAAFSDLQLAPNPAEQHSYLTLPENWEDQEVQVGIYDLNGKQVKSIPAGKNRDRSDKVRLDVEGMEQGIYIVRGRSGTDQGSAKLMIQR